MKAVDLTKGEHDFAAYSVGLVNASVCTSLHNAEATFRLNFEHPTGIESRWEIADEPFLDGTPNGAPCPHNPGTHRHLLFHC